MAIIGYHIGKEICDALGLSEHQISRVVIDIAPNDIVKVYVQKNLMDHEAKPLCDALAKAKDKAEIIECERPVVIDEKGNITV